MSMEHVGNYPIVGDMTFAKGILMLDDGEGTYVWTTTGTGADFAGSHETTAAFFGTKGMKLITRVTDPAEDDYVRAVRTVALPEAGLVVWRTLVRLPDVSDVKTFHLMVTEKQGVRAWNYELKWTVATPKVEVLTTSGAYTEITEFAKAIDDGGWQVVELVLNVADHEYVSALMFGVRKDLAGVPAEDGGASGYSQMEISLVVVGARNEQAECNLDSLYCGEYKVL